MDSGSTVSEPAGQGAAFREIGGVKFFACVVLNAIGAVFDRNGNIVRGHVDPESGARMTYLAEIERQAAAARAAQQPRPGNTTITVVVTNQTVRGHDLTQLGRQVHSSMARAIQPFHTRDDGDALWMVSTGEVEVPQWSTTGLGVVASEVVWDAVLVGPSVTSQRQLRSVAGLAARLGPRTWQPRCGEIPRGHPPCPQSAGTP